MSEVHEKIKCEICEMEVHSIDHHLREAHVDKSGKPVMTLAEYQAKFPGKPVLSAAALKLLQERKMQMAGPAAAAPAAAPAFNLESAGGSTVVQKNFHEVFDIAGQPGAMNKRGGPIPIETLEAVDKDIAHLVPEVDLSYAFVDIDSLKNVALGFDLSMPIYNWGHFGTGKTSLFEQFCAKTGRPFLRVQHTIGVEESHVLGQWTVKGGETIFQPGPLAECMRYGIVYCADEYDMALPAVLALYQPVLEGKSLVIKDAPPEWRIVKPHRNFRIVATGNTNGSGDESGLYQGAQVQNAANYDRFGVVIHTKYLPPAVETSILVNKARVSKEIGEKLVDFANRIRTSFDGSEMSATISPRTLINAGKVGARKGSWINGLEVAFINKLNRTDTEIAKGIAQRIFATT